MSDELLYHYTTVDSFLNIRKTSSLWASHIGSLNDTSEQRLIWYRVRARIKDRIKLANDEDVERLAGFWERAASPSEMDIFVISFSKDGGDRLSQWRGYGGAGGISLGFESSELKKRCSAFTTLVSKAQGTARGFALLNPVRYVDPNGDENTGKIIDIFLDNPIPVPLESPFSKKEVFNRRIAFSSTTMKHNAFREEQESRIVILDVPEGDTYIRYRSRKSMIVPYVEFDLAINECMYPLISRIVVGPSLSQAESIATLRKMLDSRVVVDGSEIPYRDW